LSERLRIVIAEDNYLVREGTRELLHATGDVAVVAAVGNADDLLDAAERLRPDAVLTDVRMPPGHHMEGIVAAHTIRRRHETVGVVVLSQHADEAYAFHLFQDGTAGLGYLLKERVGDASELVRALREAASGRSVIDAIIVDALVGRRTRAATSPLRELNDRERAVLNEMAQGKTNAAIAQTLHLSESAIEKHVRAIFAKLDLPQEPQIHRRVAAVLTYLRDGGVSSR
jgi:DNA-binding NarL/FixJ family response regulator